MIALALALRPKFIVADEPTTALDVLVEAQILRILADIRERYSAAILLITHNLGIVAEACDRVAVMYAGQIVEQGPVREIFAEPQHPYTQELLRSTISLTTQDLALHPRRAAGSGRSATRRAGSTRAARTPCTSVRPASPRSSASRVTSRTAGCSAITSPSLTGNRCAERRWLLPTKPEPTTVDELAPGEPLISVRDLRVALRAADQRCGSPSRRLVRHGARH